MNTERLTQLVEKAQQRHKSILTAKGRDYAGPEGTDRLANFRRLAQRLDLPMRVVWAVYFMKHIDAIMSWVKTGKVESEGLQGRFDDAHNYLYLVEAIVQEERDIESLQPGKAISLSGPPRPGRWPWPSSSFTTFDIPDDAPSPSSR